MIIMMTCRYYKILECGIQMTKSWETLLCHMGEQIRLNLLKYTWTNFH